MNKAPSRSEIESALNSGSKKRTRRGSAKTKQAGLPPSTRGTRTIIGGDPAGVSQNIKSSNRYLIGGIVVIILLVAIAFFIPSPSNPPQPSIANIEPSTNEFINQKSEELTFDGAFVKPNDLQRANSYREEERLEYQIAGLLDKANLQLSDAKLSLPKNDNALETYNAILEIDPKNRKAKTGIRDIRQHFANNVAEAIEADDLAEADKNLSKLEAIDPQAQEYLDAKDQYEVWRRASLLSSLYEKAKDAIADERFILPNEDSAHFYYQEMLSLDAENTRAKKGISDLANIFVKKANDAISEGEYQAATGFLSTVGAIQPDNKSIDLIRSIIVNGEALEKERRENASSVARDTSSQVRATPQPSSPTSNVESRQIEQQQSTTSTSNVSALPTPSNTSDAKTPETVASEQLVIDKQYLDRGLRAYYQGDYPLAKSLLQPLADKGISRAQVRLGYMHYFGRGFDKDTQEADRIIRAALPAVQKFADEGRAWAQSDMGSLHEDGLVLPRNYSEAVAWYRLAAEQGYPGAQTNLGTMYALGRGVARSRQSAIQWFQRAAKQGDSVAKNNLEAMGAQ